MSYAIGIDFGLKRCGIAISDVNKIIATPLDTVNSTQLIEYLEQLFCSKNIETIVLGFPKKLNGQDAHITTNVLELKQVLNEKFVHIKTVLIDERFTSKMAMRTIQKAGLKKKQRQDKALVDKISASIILQDFLNIESTKLSS